MISASSALVKAMLPKNDCLLSLILTSSDKKLDARIWSNCNVNKLKEPLRISSILVVITRFTCICPDAVQSAQPI